MQISTSPFFEVLSLCHTVQIELPSNGTAANSDHDNIEQVDPVERTDMDEVDGVHYKYNASSPDEKALVEACRMYVDICYV